MEPDRKPSPGLLEQMLVTIKILFVTGLILGGIWLVDYLVS